jgi:hypothetical protein
MLSLMLRVDQVMSAWRVSALLYEVAEDGTRTLLSTHESWLDSYPEHDGADALTQTVGVALRWSVMTMSRD